MMSHINEDRLLEYALELSSSDSERADIAAHLAECQDCAERLEKIRSDVGIIGGIRPSKTYIGMPRQHSRQTFVYAILRAAALIIIGIFAGLGMSSRFTNEHVCVSPSYVIASPPEPSAGGCSASDATGISSSYYEKLLRETE